MTPRTLNTLLWTGAILCVAGSALAVAVAVTLPLDEAPQERTGTDHRIPSTQPVESISETFALDNVWSRSLRTGLTEAAPTMQRTGNAQPSGTPQLLLVGTIGQSVALLQSGGSVEAALVGDTVAGAEVISIRPGEVQLRQNDQLFTLTKSAEEPGP